MDLLKQWKSLVTCVVMIVVVLFVTSLLDIVLVTIYPRFYSNVLFIVTFGVGGMFAAVLSFMYGVEMSDRKNEWTRWSLIILIMGIGLLFFFFLAKIEGGEYERAFKAYGATLALASLLFVKEKIE